MKNVKIFWGLLLSISVCFIVVFTLFLLQVIYPFHVEQIKNRARETVDHLQFVMPHLSPEIRQSYLETMFKKSEGLSYLLLMDVNGVAIAHSEPTRVGMKFYDSQFARSLETGLRIEHIYMRDADNPSSPHHNEKTIDIIEPYYLSSGEIAGAVNVGISLSGLEKIKHKYIVVSVAGAVLWILFISGFAFSHIRSAAQTKKLNEALKENEKLLSRAIKATSDAIWEWNLVTGKIYYTPLWYEMLGYSDQELEMNFETFKQLCHPDDRPVTLECLQSTILDAHNNKGFASEFRMKCKDGSWKWILGRGNVVEFDTQGKPSLLSGTNTDISERKIAESLTRESEARYRSIIENIQDVFYRTDNQELLTLVSPSGVRLLGYDSADEMLDRPISLFWDVPDEREHMLKQIREDGFVKDYEVTLKKKDGSTVHVSVNSAYYYDGFGAVQGLEGTFRDISERKRAETEQLKLQKQLVQAQKMEAIGTLAGGIAHDFNNILSAIFGYSELALLNKENPLKLSQYILGIQNAAERAKALVSQILTFSRQTESKIQPLQPKLLIKEALKLLRASLPATIEIKDKLNSSSMILGDPTQFHQVIMNLCTNAAHAMKERGGVLKICLEDVTIDESFATLYPGINVGPHIRLKISDTGHGISQENRERIFDPFFTTKQKDEGTGLGLAVVHGIVQSFKGIINVYSEIGKGTEFTLYFPVSNEPDTSVVKAENPTLPHGNERILLIDDEPSITSTEKEMLEKLGYSITAFNDSNQALNCFRSTPYSFDLVITDYAMPGMSGLNLATHIKEIRNDINVILCSGYFDESMEVRAHELGIYELLNKPLTTMELALSIRKVFQSQKGQ